MELGNDLLEALRQRVSPQSGAPEWAGLHARLSAAHAAARAFAQGSGLVPARAGDFTLWQAHAGSNFNAERPVNPADLADGKSAEGIEHDTAGGAIAGGRGQ
ncbi:MAG TPA: hypothetical protein VFV30_00725 [Novosphingobium sp.]|nr:hypothetical protein [Novosphingobium sp.]